MAKSIEVTLKFNDRDFTRGIRNANRQLDKLQRNLRQSGSGAKGLSGRQGMGGLTTAIAAVGAATVASSSKIASQVRISSSFGTQISDNVRRLQNYFQSVKGSSKSSSELYNVTRRLGTANKELQGELHGLRGDLDGTGAGFKETGGKMGKFAIVAATVAVAVGAIALSFRTLTKSIGVSAEFEQIEITLSNLTGTVEKGARAMEVLTDKAQELPFAFEELAGASPVLLTVSKNLQEFQDNIQLAADIAANFKIPFDQAASSLQRAFSAGAASADVFREKGVLSMAGFQAGVSYSVDETIEKFREFGIKINGVSKNLNDSLTGAASQAGDSLTLFNRELGDALKPELTAFLLTLTNLFRQNKSDIDAFAKSMGTNVFNAFVGLAKAIAILIDIVKLILVPFKVFDDVLNKVGLGLPTFAAGILAVVVALKAYKSAQLAAASALIFFQGVTGVGLIKVGAGIVAATAAAYALSEAFDEVMSSDGEGSDLFPTLDTFNELLDTVTDSADKLRTKADAVKTSVKPLVEELVDAANSAGDAGDKVKTFADRLSELKEAIELGTGGLTQYNLLLDTLKKFLADGKIGLSEYNNLVRDLDEAFMQNEGLNNFIDTLAEAQKALSTDLATALLEGQNAGDAFQNFFKKLVTQILADILRLQIIQPILGALLSPFGFGFGAGGSISKLPTPSGDGGGFTGAGSRSGGIDGRGGFPAILHPNETVVDHTKGQGMGTVQNTAVTYNINAVDARSFKQLVAADPEYLYNITQVGARRQPR